MKNYPFEQYIKTRMQIALVIIVAMIVGVLITEAVEFAFENKYIRTKAYIRPVGDPRIDALR